MRYLITRQTQLFDSEIYYKCISVEESLEMLYNYKVVGLDTETEGFDPYTKSILLVQIGTFESQFAIDTSTIDIQLYKEYFESDVLFILQNAKFDLRFFFHHRIVIKNVFDTYLAEKLLYLGYPDGYIPMSLDALTERYLGVKLDKSIRATIPKEGLSTRVIIYGCDDVKYLIPLREKQLNKLKEMDLLDAIKIENAFVVVLAYVEYCGMKLDEKKWREKMNKDKDNYNKQIQLLNDWVIHYNNPKFIYQNPQGDLFSGFSGPQCNINWSSPKQVIPLFEELGFNLMVKDKETGVMKKSVESPIIEIQKKISDISPIYLEFKKYEKLISTYGEEFIKAINPVSKRIHTQFNQLMDTTRISSGGKDKDTKQDNINFQNIPSDEETRACFISEEGNSLIDCDYTAQEDLVFTQASQEPQLIAFYNDKTKKRDGHSFVAKLCFPDILKDIPEEDVKKIRPDLRKNAKSAKFAIHYGGNGLTISKNLSLSVELGESIYKSYLAAFPYIDKYFKYIKKATWDRGYVLISPITKHRTYIYDWKDLKNVEKRFNSEFWNNYRVEKPLYKEGSNWFHSLKNNIKKKYIRDIFKDFSEGENIEDIAKKYNLSLAIVYVEIVKHFFKRKGAAERMALNYPIQGTSAQITKIAAVRFFKWLVKEGLLFIVLIPNLVHDEMMAESPDNISEKVANNLSRCMEEAGKIFVTCVELKAVPEIGKHWVH